MPMELRQQPDRLVFGVHAGPPVRYRGSLRRGCLSSGLFL